MSPPTPSTWKEALAGQTDPEWEREIDLFEGQLALRRQVRILNARQLLECRQPCGIDTLLFLEAFSLLANREDGFQLAGVLQLGLQRIQRLQVLFLQ